MTRACLLVAALALIACSRRDAGENATATGASSPSSSTAPAGPSSAPKVFGAFCVEDAECSGDVCCHKRIKVAGAAPERRGADDPVEHDGFCSMRCESDRDCPAPPTRGKCGARGMCK